MEKMQERRKWKNRNTEEGKRTYRRLNNELRRETDQARERWWENECNKLEELDRRARPDLVYAKVEQLTRKKTTNCTSEAVKDETGKLLTEPEEIGTDGRSILRLCMTRMENLRMKRWELNWSMKLM